MSDERADGRRSGWYKPGEGIFGFGKLTEDILSCPQIQLKEVALEDRAKNHLLTRKPFRITPLGEIRLIR